MGLGLGLDWTEGKGWGLELGNFVPFIMKWGKSTPPLKTPYDTQSKKSKAQPDLNFWAPAFMAEGPFLGLSDTNLGSQTSRLKGPSEPTQFEFFIPNSVT